MSDHTLCYTERFLMKTKSRHARPSRRRSVHPRRPSLPLPPLPIPVDVMTRCLRYFREEAL